MPTNTHRTKLMLRILYKLHTVIWKLLIQANQNNLQNFKL